VNALDGGQQPNRSKKICTQFLMSFCMGNNPELSTRACRVRAQRESSRNAEKPRITEDDIWEHGIIVDKAVAEKYRLLGR
jgi:hypothetical protein